MKFAVILRYCVVNQIEEGCVYDFTKLRKVIAYANIRHFLPHYTVQSEFTSVPDTKAMLVASATDCHEPVVTVTAELLEQLRGCGRIDIVAKVVECGDVQETQSHNGGDFGLNSEHVKVCSMRFASQLCFIVQCFVC